MIYLKNIMLHLNNNSLLHLKSGIKKYIGLEKGSIGTGGSDNSRYCYSLWLRHLYYLNLNYGLNNLPDSILEVGPGDSIGTGLIALLMGVNSYTALDAVEHTNAERNLKILGELYNLLINSENIPDNEEFPTVYPPLDDYSFPDFLKILIPAKEEIRKRKHEIEKALINQSDAIKIIYICNWKFQDLNLNKQFDIIYSQAVMEHIDDLNKTYFYFHKWLKNNGYISHTIDYRCHGQSDKWNGHWEINNVLWKIILKGYGYCINRKPHSYHANLINKYFKDVKVMSNYDNTGINKSDKNRFKDFTADDFLTSLSFIQGVRKD